MQPSAIGLMAKNYRTTSGFTLIELLVVLVIMAIVATIASLSVVGAGRTGELQNAAINFSQALTLASQYAITQPTEVGLVFTKKGYTFYQFNQPQDDYNPEDGSWEPIQGIIALHARSFPNNVVINFEYDLKHPNPFIFNASPTQHRVLLSSNGNITPFTLKLGFKGEKPLFEITVDTVGNVTEERLGDKVKAKETADE